jgi:phenylalanyl-tRNA synthetase beta chain
VKYLLSWIREYAPVDKTQKEISAILMDLGMNLEASEVLADDAVLELEITANRPDALSHLGIAREVAVHCGVPLRKPELLELEVAEKSDPSGMSDVKIIIENPDLCPRYCALVVEDVRIGPSPEWLAKRLELAGIRPINCMVDITNYVLAAVGHPLHAFDLDRLAEGTVRVRGAKPSEVMRTLDGVDRKFNGGECLICDARRPVAVAGVMGGLETEIHAGTRRVLLESAYFNPDSVRRTSRFWA